MHLASVTKCKAKAVATQWTGLTCADVDACPNGLESQVTCERMLQVEEQLVLIQQACEGVVSSRQLKLLLHCLLDGGNYLNEGTLRAGALGTSPKATAEAAAALHHLIHCLIK